MMIIKYLVNTIRKFIYFSYFLILSIRDYFVGNNKMSTIPPNPPPRDNTTEEKISKNAKIILLSLFILIGFIVGTGTYVMLAKPDVSIEVLTIIFSTALTGCFTLAGTLIQTLWGK